MIAFVREGFALVALLGFCAAAMMWLDMLARIA